MALSTRISEFLTDDHNKVISLIDALIDSLNKGRFDSSLLDRIETGLKTHIFWEETFLFPKSNSNLSRKISGLEMEHGAIWKLLEVIKSAMLSGDLNLALRRLESLKRVLKSHDYAEESDVYIVLDAILEDNVDAVSALQKIDMPEGWICSVLRK